MDDLIQRLRIRAEIRRQAKDRKSVQNGEPDRISDLLEEAAQNILDCKHTINQYERDVQDLQDEIKYLRNR